ncbi:MAG: TIGR03862 family flavoprotein, partial [Burkholderiaceae bacterium]|nr:TIGR03862 family flavoprotein [Burkholderiaceae bacterium]
MAGPRRVAVVGGGPAGLMAAEALALGGCRVEVFDAMPSVGRKFLLAGKGGLNITHAEPFESFLSRFGEAAPWLAPMLERFGPAQLRPWVHALGIETFVGTSGRVFPEAMKAAPLLRAWLHRLRGQGVQFHQRHRLADMPDPLPAFGGGEPAPGGLCLRFDSPGGLTDVSVDAAVLALGGASWSRLGSDGRWRPMLQSRGVPLSPLQPANCGFDAGWTEHLRSRFAGAAVKSVAARLDADQPWRQGEFVLTETGLEGSLIYTLVPALRAQIAQLGEAALLLDLLPARSLARVQAELDRPRAGRSMANHLRVRLGLEGAKAALLRECATPETFSDPQRLAQAIKSLRVRLFQARPIDEAISTAGGVA